MKATYTLVIIAFGLLGWFLSTRTTAYATPREFKIISKDTINFKSQIQPLLVKNCSPCHFPGGKMYEKLPFDKEETIVNHEPGVFKRIKKENEVSLVKQFIDQYRKLN